MVPPVRPITSILIPVLFFLIIGIQNLRITNLVDRIHSQDARIDFLAKAIGKTSDLLGQRASTDHKLADNQVTEAQGMVRLSRSIDALQSEIGAIMKVLGSHRDSIDQLQGHSLLREPADNPVYFEFGTMREVAPTDDPPKPWNAAMCRVAQKPTVSDAYISFCMRESEKYPVCKMTLPPHEAPVYFEVLDCSWHAGDNPRVDNHAGLR